MRTTCPCNLEDFHPGESFASYYARRAVKERRLRIEEERKADEERRLRVEEERKANEVVRLAGEEKRKADEEKRTILELLQQGKHEEAMQLLAKGLPKATSNHPT
jgi:hypothetical protein